jgi:hypothetical protein
MRNSRKWLSVVGLVGAPVVYSLLSVVAPQAGLLAIFFLGLPFFSGALILVLIIAAASGLVTGQNDPLRPFIFAVL